MDASSVAPPGLADLLAAGNRRALARAITLVESTRADHRAQAEDLLAAVMPRAGGAVRVAISGAPGVGKSTFIEAFGLHLIAQGRRVAVLAIDPSSKVSGGSILGDKTRMAELSRDPAAFIRPSPAGATLGGVARRTREAMLLCEAAGFDVAIVETVGVGQSETMAADMTDLFMLLLSPGAGDDLQGIKKGIVELAELIVVNKADGEAKAAARRTVADYRHALRLLRPTDALWKPPVQACSALTGDGIDGVWSTILEHRRIMEESGHLARRRADQARAWLWSEIGETLIDRFRRHDAVRAKLAEVEAAVIDGTLAPSAGARELLAAFLG